MGHLQALCGDRCVLEAETSALWMWRQIHGGGDQCVVEAENGTWRWKPVIVEMEPVALQGQRLVHYGGGDRYAMEAGTVHGGGDLCLVEANGG